MRIFLLLLCALSINITLAQRGGGGRQGGQSMGGGQGQGMGDRQHREVVEFDANKVAGIFNYDVEITVKKIKIKKKQNDIKFQVRKNLDLYNIRVNEIALLNKDNFDTLNVFVNAQMKSRQSSRQNNQMNGGSERRMERVEDSDDSRKDSRKLVEEKINPAKHDVEMAEEKLNANLESILSDKQYKKWLNYQAQVKEDLEPKEENNQDRASGMSRGSGQAGPPGGGGRR